MNNLILNITAILVVSTPKDGSVMDAGIFYLVFFLVAIFVLLLALVFLRVRVVQIFRLWYIMLVHGRYSYEYLNFFKDNNLRSPFSSCIKDEITIHLLVFFRKIKDSQEFQTTTNIDFGEIPYLISSKKLFKIKGNPNCMKVAKVNDVKYMIAGYNGNLQGARMKSIFFFVNDRFVMGEFLFSDLLRVKPVNLVETLSAKYLSKNPVTCEVFYITDPNGNQLNYEFNGFSVSIKYLFNGDQATNTILTSLLGADEYGAPEPDLPILGDHEL